jgi:hypothetical protein
MASPYIWEKINLFGGFGCASSWVSLNLIYPWKKWPGVMPTTYALFNPMVPFDSPAIPFPEF